MNTKRPLPKRFAGTTRVAGILVGLLALSLTALIAGVAGAAPFAYAANSGLNNVSVIDGATNTVVQTIAVGRNPLGVAVNPASKRAYVTNSASRNVSVNDTANRGGSTTVSLGHQ